MEPVKVKIKWLVRIALVVVLGFVVFGCADIAPVKSVAADAGIRKTSAPTVPQSKKYRKKGLVKIATIGPGGLTVNANAKPQQVVDQVIRHWQRKFDQVLPDRPDLIVVPEACDSPRGLSRESKKEYYNIRKNQIQDFFGRVARENNCYMVYPSAKREMPDGTYRNSSILLDRKGKVVGIYNKNHPTIGEMDGRTLCGRDAPVFECDFGRVAFAICFDLNFDELRLKYVKSKPDLIIFSSMYHGGLMQAYWAYSCQCHFVGAIAGRATPSEIRNPLGQVIASSTNYCDFAVAEVNLDCRLVHLQNMSAQSNWGRLKTMKKKYGPKIKITDPGLLGPVLVASEHETINVDEMIEEFDISLWDEDMTEALSHRLKPGNMESASPPQADRLK
jgi:Carbon-nitrogen hydrolase